MRKTEFLSHSRQYLCSQYHVDTVGLRPKFMPWLVAKVSSLQGENSVSLYLRLSCCQLRFRFCLPIIASFDLFSFAKGAELESTHAHNCVARSVHPTCACVYARHRCPTSPALLSVVLFEDMAMMWMKVRSRSRPGMYYYFNRATQESTWKEPPRHLISEVCRAPCDFSCLCSI